VHAPAAAVEYARRLAQRGTPLTALLRAYRLGPACLSSWLLRELARQADDAQMITAVTLDMPKIVAGYIDQTSEKMVTSYARERENWLRNRSAARAARVRDLLSGARIDVRAAEATLGYRLRQYRVGAGRATRRAPQTRSPGSSARLAASRRRRIAPAIRCSRPGTSRARGRGCRWGSATGSTARRPARPAWTATSTSPSATSRKIPRAFASPTSRPSRPRR